MSLIINPYLVSPGGATNPADITGLVRWYKADTFALADNDDIGSAGREWVDNSSSAAEGYVEAPFYPKFRTNVFGSMPAIQFIAGSSLYLRMDDLVIAGDFTLICIGSVTADSCVMGDNVENVQFGRIYPISNNTISFSFAGGISGVSSDVFANAQTVVRMMTWRRTAGANVSFREQSIFRGFGIDGGGNFPFTSKQIGRGGSGYATGYYGEICAYNVAISNVDVDSLYLNYFKVRYPSLP